MIKYRIPLLLQCLTLLVPLNIYMWGDWILVSLQWAFFRYQETAVGSALFPLNRDISFILLGYSTGIHNILAVVFWTAGSILLLGGVLLTLIACIRGEALHIRTASFFTFGAGILFGISALERFPSGFAIPLGLPVLFIIAWITYRQQPESCDDDGDGGDDTAGDGELPAGPATVPGTK